jgi:hypothetical protein
MPIQKCRTRQSWFEFTITVLMFSSSENFQTDACADLREPTVSDTGRTGVGKRKLKLDKSQYLACHMW